MDPAREWTFFVAGTFALMGGSLIAGAGKRAADALIWENERRRLATAEPVACDGPFLSLQLYLNRGVGVAAVFVGLAIAAAGKSGRLLSWRPSGAIAAALGVALIAVGLVGAAAHALENRPVPRFVQDAEPRSSATLSVRASTWTSWVLRAWWLVFGARLLLGLRG